MDLQSGRERRCEEHQESSETASRDRDQAAQGKEETQDAATQEERRVQKTLVLNRGDPDRVGPSLISGLPDSQISNVDYRAGRDVVALPEFSLITLASAALNVEREIGLNLHEVVLRVG